MWFSSSVAPFLLLTLQFPITILQTLLHHPARHTPFCIPTPTHLISLGWRFAFLHKDTLLCVNCMKVSSIHPLAFICVFASSLSGKVLSLFLSKTKIPICTQDSIPLHHLKTWFSIIPSFCSFHNSLSTHSFSSTNKYIQVPLTLKSISLFFIFL